MKRDHTTLDDRSAFFAAARDAAHLMLPVEGQRYAFKRSEGERPYVRGLCVAGVSAYQFLTYGLMPVVDLLNRT